ncbi:Na+/H+ antiporter NhaA [Paracoccaceae bacterium Fryx2]|nr:Na+/H+ antiporter NhaA [Paracoccaceae bacterium Fryx2]
MYRVSSFIRHFAWALLSGVALATLWVNLSPGTYYDAIEWRLADLPLELGPRGSLTLRALVSEVLMALFLFYLGKELWEALVLNRGALRGRRAVVPMMAAAGGMIGAVLVWLVLAALFETAEEATPGIGWAVPLGSDVVLGYVIGRRLFGPGHPALHMLLLTAIAANIAGLLVRGVSFPPEALRPLWLILPLAASLALAAFCRLAVRSERARRRALHMWPYLLAGAASWVGVTASGLPGALGLLPILPAIPHADRAFGLFAEAEEFLTDPLNRFAHLMVRPLIVVLFLFGLTRGGIDLGAMAPTTGIVLGALWLGKPLGFLAGGVLALRLFGLRLPRGVTLRDLALVGLISGMGFTLPMLALETELPGGAMQEAARLGLALSLAAGPIALMLGRLRARG